MKFRFLQELFEVICLKINYNEKTKIFYFKLLKLISY